MKARIVKTDTAGNIIWDKKYSPVLFMGASSTIDELSDGSIVATGSGAFEDCMCFMAWIIKVKPNGDSIWMRRYVYQSEPNLDNDFLYDVLFTSDHGIIFTGETTGPIEHLPYIWVQKLDSIGCDSVGCDTTVGIPHNNPPDSSLTNIVIFPNPAKDQIHILYRDQRQAWPADRIFIMLNVYGERVKEIAIPRLSKSFDCDISNLPNGIYFITIIERQKVISSSKIVISR